MSPKSIMKRSIFLCRECMYLQCRELMEACKGIVLQHCNLIVAEVPEMEDRREEGVALTYCYVIIYFLIRHSFTFFLTDEYSV